MARNFEENGYTAKLNRLDLPSLALTVKLY